MRHPDDLEFRPACRQICRILLYAPELETKPMKRIALLIATNLAVMLLLSVVVQVFGIDNYLAQRGLNYQSLLIFSAVLGFGGAFFSLAISKWTAKKMMGVHVIEQPASEDRALARRDGAQPR